MSALKEWEARFVKKGESAGRTVRVSADSSLEARQVALGEWIAFLGKLLIFVEELRVLQHDESTTVEARGLGFFVVVAHEVLPSSPG